MKVQAVRYVSNDQLWHVVYEAEGGGELYDRVPKEVALGVLALLEARGPLAQDTVRELMKEVK